MYHKVTRDDCLMVATDDVKKRLDMITDIHLLGGLAEVWCAMNEYKLGGYLGNSCWDAVKRSKINVNSY